MSEDKIVIDGVERVICPHQVDSGMVCHATDREECPNPRELYCLVPKRKQTEKKMVVFLDGDGDPIGEPHYLLPEDTVYINGKVVE